LNFIKSETTSLPVISDKIFRSEPSHIRFPRLQMSDNKSGGFLHDPEVARCECHGQQSQIALAHTAPDGFYFSATTLKSRCFRAE
jgi:hypothetical protein